MGQPFTFNDEESSIRITNPRLPGPWINYLSNETLHAFVSHAGGGFLWLKSSSDNRITRYRQHHLPIDSPGFYLYIRNPSGKVWSPSWRPCEVELDQWEASHQPGMTSFTAEYEGVKARLSLFIAPDEDVLVWDIDLLNDTNKPAQIEVFGYVEFSINDWRSENGWGYYQRHMCRTWFCERSKSVKYLYRNFYSSMVRRFPLMWMAGTEPVKSFSGSRDDFCGAYRSERNPIGAQLGQCSNDELDTGYPAGVIHNSVSLEAHCGKRLALFTGVTAGAMEDFAAAESRQADVLERLRSPGYIEMQKAKCRAWWDEHFEHMQVTIPDRTVQRHINIWTPVNTVHTGRYSRSVNTLAPGIRGVGFRDTCQDMLSVAYRRPDWAKRVLCYLLSQQFEDGHTVHTSYPEEGNTPTMSVHSDDHLWLPLVVKAVLAETNDFGLLDEEVPFLAVDGASAGRKATIWEHMLALVRFTEGHLGAHSIPLTLASDWNDIIGRFAREGRGESTFASMQYVMILRILRSIALLHGKNADEEWLEDCLKRQQHAVESCAWDGLWWLRGFDDDGNPIGSQQSSFGQLFLNPQSWAVLAGLGTVAQQCGGMDSAHRRLDTGMGLKLLDPGYSTYPEVHEPFSGYSPGTGENGAVFCHANTWAVIAEAMLGRSSNAWKIYMNLLPENALNKVGLERYASEPYAWVSNIVGPENNRFGWANISHVTGTATWMDIAATQYLLGIRPELEGLVLDPCIPVEWDSFKATRSFMNAIIHIEVDNPRHVAKGVASYSVNGNTMNGPRAILPHKLAAGARDIHLKVVLGE